MTSLADLLGVDLSSASECRAVFLEESDARLIRDLVELRVRLGLSQKDLADRLEIAQSSIAAFERYDNDPKLSTIRRYAHALGALVSHSVEEDRGQLPNTRDWEADATLSFSMRVSMKREIPGRGWSEVA
jgi:transcriptional regulator with XRE-family HTH domain